MHRQKIEMNNNYTFYGNGVNGQKIADNQKRSYDGAFGAVDNEAV
jgi:hypothetical protein